MIKKLPALKLCDASGVVRDLAEWRGSWAVIYFYPQDDTPGCTVEANEFTELLPQFKELNAAVIGISPDSSQSHAAFIDKCGIGHTLLADVEKEAVNAFDVWGTKKNYGKEYQGLIRSTFLADPHGDIVHEWKNVKAKGHAARVLEKLKSSV